MAAREFLHDDRAARPAIFTLVVGAHLAALLILSMEDYELVIDEYQRARAQPAPTILRLVVPGGIDDRGLLIIPDARLPPSTVDSPSPPRLAPSPPATTDPTTALPDWKQSGADAAADAARDNYRALGPRPAEPSVKQSPSPFAPPPRHKYGELDVDELKNPIVWLSEHCWLRPRNFEAEPGDPFANIPMTFCSSPLGKTQPRGDLFQHLRKQPPAP